MVSHRHDCFVQSAEVPKHAPQPAPSSPASECGASKPASPASVQPLYTVSNAYQALAFWGHKRLIRLAAGMGVTYDEMVSYSR